jgi:hypothetical protein
MKPIKKIATHDLEIITPETLNSLRGGKAEVLLERRQKPQQGDGANYVCCINI